MLSTSHRVFLEVATHLSFSKAARTLYISQPSISRHISLLEQTYNCALFERNGNNIRLTEIGKKIYDYLLEAKNIQEKIDYEVSVLKTEHEAVGKLKLGASTTVALYILPKILSRFHKEHSSVEIQVLNRNTENILIALQEKKIDLGVVEVENKLNSLDYTHFTSDKVIAVCAASSRLATGDSLALADLTTIPVALRELGSGTLSSLARELGRNGISVSDLNAKVRLGGTEALKNFIREDDSLGFLPQKAVLKELRQQEFREVPIAGFEIKRDFFFVTRKGDDFGLVKTFVRYARQAVKDDYLA